jgi:hypothetical protein
MSQPHHSRCARTLNLSAAMLRPLSVACLIFSCLAPPAWSQAQPETAPTVSAPAKPVAKKPAPKAKTAPKPAAATTDSGPCQIGVIPAIGDKFVLEHIGLTVFGNELADAPIASWGLDDLVVARARAAAGGQSVRRITYARDAFEPYYHPPRELFRDPKNDLVNVVRQVAANTDCERYLVVTRFSGQVPGTNQSATGVGLLTNWASGSFKYAQLFSFVGITVFDGKTFVKRNDPVGFGARLADHLSHLGRSDFFEPLKDFEVPTTPEAIAGNSRLRDGARAMIAARLDKELPAYLNDHRTAQ